MARWLLRDSTKWYPDDRKYRKYSNDRSCAAAVAQERTSYSQTAAAESVDGRQQLTIAWPAEPIPTRIRTFSR